MKNGPRVWAFCKIEFPGIQKPVQILTQKSAFFKKCGNRGVGVIWLVCGGVVGFVWCCCCVGWLLRLLLLCGVFVGVVVGVWWFGVVVRACWCWLLLWWCWLWLCVVCVGGVGGGGGCGVVMCCCVLIYLGGCSLVGCYLVLAALSCLVLLIRAFYCSILGV